MPKLVKLTGTFLTPAGAPLTGEVIIRPVPELVVAPDENRVYAGQVVLKLNGQGKISCDFIATENWEYEVILALATTDGNSSYKRTYFVRITDDSDLSDLIAEKISRGIKRPVLTYSRYLPGEVTAAGATPDPDDDGAVLLPVASA